MKLSHMLYMIDTPIYMSYNNISLLFYIFFTVSLLSLLFLTIVLYQKEKTYAKHSKEEYAQSDA